MTVKWRGLRWFVLCFALILSAAACDQGPSDTTEPGEMDVQIESGGDDSSQEPRSWLHVREFGAVPDDGEDDTRAIHEAILSAAQDNIPTVVFDEGVYNLRRPYLGQAMVYVVSKNELTLTGQTSPDGQPTTVLEVNLSLGNDIVGVSHIQIQDSKQIKIQNMILDHNPRFGTAGTIVEVDRAKDAVVVDIFPELPHFDGMKSYSANSWDLSTRQLMPVQALTIGVNQSSFRPWTKVSGFHSRYRIEGMGFANRVEPGEGISWHFNVTVPNGHTVNIHNSEDVTLENVHIYSTLGMSVFARHNKDLAFRQVHIKPEGQSLAVGPRDAFHLSINAGKLLMDDVYVKGVRWDPINNRVKFLEITDKVNDSTVRAYYDSGAHHDLNPGDKVVFWVGDTPFERQLEEAESPSPRMFLLTFTEPLPESAGVGSMFTPLSWNWSEAVIRNSVFEGNFGTAILYQGENLLVEHTRFVNNAYGNISLGPVGVAEGGFARNIVIRNNQFIGSTWINKFNRHDGTITTYQNHPGFTNQPYNMNIRIENNVFEDIHRGDHATAIYLQNAQNVEVRGNTYINVKDALRIDPRSTANIVVDGQPVQPPTP